jgi:hypothetical protein
MTRRTPDRSKLFGSHGQRPWLHDAVMNRGLTDVELTGSVVLGLPSSDGGDDGPTTSGIPVVLLMMTSGSGCGFSVQNTSE